MEGSSAPTQKDFAKLQQVAEQALKTAEEAKSEGKGKATQQAEAAQTVKEESENQGLGTMTEEQANMIAAATIAQLDERGAFGSQAPPPEGQAPPPEVAAAGEAPPPQTGGSGTPPEEETFEAPRKKSLAERFQGK